MRRRNPLIHHLPSIKRLMVGEERRAKSRPHAIHPFSCQTFSTFAAVSAFTGSLSTTKSAFAR